jgi:uncharacterized cysteine cluster protein YcgN (CxxCxxCC family)
MQCTKNVCMLCTSCDFVKVYDTKIQVITCTILACTSYKIKPKKCFNLYNF